VSAPEDRPPEAPVTEEELHACLDRQLPPDRVAAVQRYLDSHPADAERFAAYAAQRDTLRSALAGLATAPVPARLHPEVVLAQRGASRRAAWRAAAMVVLALGIGTAGGWGLRGLVSPPASNLTLLAQEAIANHVVYTADRRRPTELGADQRDDLARWVSNRLNRPVAPPDLADAGFKYIGGRLAATPRGPAGLFMYQNADGIRLTVFVLPMGSAANRQPEYLDVGRLDGCAWISKGVGYTVVAPVPEAELRRLAEQVRVQLDSKA
jgi:anti-sigma factor RsiW